MMFVSCVLVVVRVCVVFVCLISVCCVLCVFVLVVVFVCMVMSWMCVVVFVLARVYKVVFACGAAFVLGVCVCA